MVIVPQVKFVPPQLVILEIFEEAIVHLRTHDPGIVACPLPAVLDDSRRRLVNICLRS
jgi:hypothetical protein